jgi:hypothetical protein
LIPSLTRIIYVPREGLSMLRRMVIYLIVVGAGFPFAASSSARERRHIDATPSLHAPCSVLSGEPCTPFCGVFHDGPCIPEIADAYGENLQVTIQSQPSHDDATKYQKPDHDLNTIGDLFAALRSCWSPPAGSPTRAAWRATAPVLSTATVNSASIRGGSSRAKGRPTCRRCSRSSSSL